MEWNMRNMRGAVGVGRGKWWRSWKQGGERSAELGYIGLWRLKKVLRTQQRARQMKEVRSEKE